MVGRRISLVLCAVAFAAVVWPKSGAAAPIIDTRFGPLAEFGLFGEPWMATIGQTFTVTGTETQLDSFSFWLDDLYPEPVDFYAYVGTWTGNSLGSLVYSHPFVSSTSTPPNVPFDGYEEFTYYTGGLQLETGVQYVAFLSASPFFDGIEGTTNILSTNDHVSSYSLGDFVFADNGSDFAALYSTPWYAAGSNCDGGCSDLAFVATLSNPAVAPEPATLLLLGLGISGFAAARHRRDSHR